MRAKDLHMAATVYPARKVVLLTGAIDTNDVTIVVRLKLPSPGVWTVMKAETNLTKEPWAAWQVTLGEGCSLPRLTKSTTPLCRQFSRAEYQYQRGAIMFSRGEVRPGEPILKVFAVQVRSVAAAGPILVVSHNRADRIPTRKEILEGFGQELPKIEVRVPVRISKS